MEDQLIQEIKNAVEKLPDIADADAPEVRIQAASKDIEGLEEKRDTIFTAFGKAAFEKYGAGDFPELAAQLDENAALIEEARQRLAAAEADKAEAERLAREEEERRLRAEAERRQKEEELRQTQRELLKTAGVACPSCGTMNLEDSNFCSACGTRLPKTPAAPAAMFCPGCGTKADPGSRFCAECGTRLF